MMNAWSERQEASDSLLQGAFLVEAERWRLDRSVDLSLPEQRYIAASRAEQTKQRRRRRVAAGGASLLGVAAVAVAAAFFAAQGKANEARVLADKNRELVA